MLNLSSGCCIDDSHTPIEFSENSFRTNSIYVSVILFMYKINENHNQNSSKYITGMP
jgi:hypothetical protein